MVYETFGDLPGVTVIADNFVYGCNDRDHEENLHVFLHCACETSLHFYLDKFECAASRSPVNIIGADGLHKYLTRTSLTPYFPWIYQPAL